MNDQIPGQQQANLEGNGTDTLVFPVGRQSISARNNTRVRRPGRLMTRSWVVASIAWVTPLLTVLCCLGCAEQDTGITTDMHEDFDHDHNHQHTASDDHEHVHDDGFRGSHSHGHAHSHRHGKPLHGGRIVSIGHTHHGNGAAHYHAEIMPLTDNTIRLHLLTESDDGKSQTCPISATEITALVGIKGHESTASEHSFVAVSDGETASEFALEIPDSLAKGNGFSIVIPRIEIGGRRQNFTFNIRHSRGDSEEPDSGGSKVTSDE